MAISVTIEQIIEETAPGTRVFVRFDDGNLREFPDLQTAKDQIAQVETRTNAENFAIARWLAQHPSGGAHQSAENKTTTIDVAAINSVSQTPALQV